MQKKLINILFTSILLVIISFSYAQALTVTLNGISNAGYSADDLWSSHLYVKDKSTGNYYYKWKYGVNLEPLAWSNLGELVADLNSKNFDWWLESGGDPFNNPSSAVWTKVFFTKGLYSLSLAGSSEAYNLSAYWGNNEWNAYVQMYTVYGDSLNFGEGSFVTSSQISALNYYRSNVDGMIISLKEDTHIFFYINDFNSVDNAGSVSLNVSNVSAVPEPGIVALLIAFITPLVVRHLKNVVF